MIIQRFQIFCRMLLSLICFYLFVTSHAFVPITSPSSELISQTTTTRLYAAEAEPFTLTVDIPPTNSGMTANMKFEPVLSVPSEIVEVRYKVPFGLNVEPKKGLAVCTQDGPGGEKKGDVLRYTSQWAMGLPDGGGIAATAAAFSGGGLSWRCSMFNVMTAKSWDEVVEALVSNEASRTDEVLLLFERPLEGTAPEVE